MTPPEVRQVVQEYVEAAAALRVNTLLITPVNGSAPEHLEQLLQDRDKVYERWKAAADKVMALPIEYTAYAICAIEELRRF